MKWNFIDAELALPTKPGNYQWWNQFLKVTPVEWRNGWYFLNGDKIPNGLVRWWR